jgi:mannose/cellobiose epimerase-like protein (N-acyl-D-glucosamine 2-epimerase family)
MADILNAMKQVFFLIFLSTAAIFSQPTSVSELPPPEFWQRHLTDDLLKFWNQPGATGVPMGNFPSILCDDGSAVNWQRPCAEVQRSAWLMQRPRILVSVSRQVYGYGVGFHMTGEARYLTLMKAGVDYIRRNAVDPAGGMFTEQNSTTSQWGPRREWRNPQELGYGLLGLTFYYYLTRDETVLPDILRIRDYILGTYYSPQRGTLDWLLLNNGSVMATEKRFVAQLDQLNAYLILGAPALPEPMRTEWIQSAVAISRLMIEQFYSPTENLFFLNANTPRDLDLRFSATDFGHTIKAMWMIRMAGQLSGAQDLVDFVETNAPRVLERAYLQSNGSWASGVQAGGALNIDKSWWIYCELDQFAASLALAKPEAARYLPATYDYWQRYFVDPQYGEVWTELDGRTNQPKTELPKAWPWKNAYHSTEHALVAYITTAQLQNKPVTLWFAFKQTPGAEAIRPYFFNGEIWGWEPTRDATHGEFQKVTFQNVR